MSVSPYQSLDSMPRMTCVPGSPEHVWDLESPADPDDPSELEIHACNACGLRRMSEWGTLPFYWRKP